MSLTYEELLESILDVTKAITINYQSEEDGRIVSAIKEKEYLDLLEAGLKVLHPSIIIVRPKQRSWYDVMIEGIPINLKITSGGTDNAFNKQAFIFTKTGKVADTSNMNFNRLLKELKKKGDKTARNKRTEYHYLVVQKQDGKILFKSILDIHKYKSNSSNILQINWKDEFKNKNYKINDAQWNQKMKELCSTVQKSLLAYFTSAQEFMDFNFDEL